MIAALGTASSEQSRRRAPFKWRRLSSAFLCHLLWPPLLSSAGGKTRVNR